MTHRREFSLHCCPHDDQCIMKVSRRSRCALIGGSKRDRYYCIPVGFYVPQNKPDLRMLKEAEQSFILECLHFNPQCNLAFCVCLLKATFKLSMKTFSYNVQSSILRGKYLMFYDSYAVYYL